MSWERVINAIIYALVAGLGVIVAGGLPGDAQSWAGLALAVLTSGWGKYTTNTELVWPPDRKQWSEDERRDMLGLPAKRPGQ